MMNMRKNARHFILVVAAALGVSIAPAQQNWQSRDIGNTIPGTTNFSNGVFTIEGNGNDIWSSADGFRFVYLEGEGDIEIVARVTSQEVTNQWAKCGVMIRQSLAAGSTHAFMSRTPANGMAFQWRPVADADSNNDNGGPNALPRWVRLRRSGNLFSGYYASDSGGRPGAWVQQGGAVPVTMTGPVYVGLAVSSHEAGNLCTAVFDNVETTGTRKSGAGIIIGRAEPEPLVRPDEFQCAGLTPSRAVSRSLFGSATFLPRLQHRTAAVAGRWGPKCVQFSPSWVPGLPVERKTPAF